MHCIQERLLWKEWNTFSKFLLLFDHRSFFLKIAKCMVIYKLLSKNKYLVTAWYAVKEAFFITALHNNNNKTTNFDLCLNRLQVKEMSVFPREEEIKNNERRTYITCIIIDCDYDKYQI